MKAFKLKEPKSFIKILKEPPLKKKKTNWSRYLYLGLLIVAALYFGRKIYNANMVIFANGQIELPKQTISFAHDIQIIDIAIQEGQSICKGEVLFNYKIIPSSEDQQQLSLQNNRPIDWILKEKLSTEHKIASNNLTISEIRHQISITQNTIQTKEQLLLLGLHREQDAYQKAIKEKSKLKSRIKILEEENKLLNKSIRNLRRSESSYNQLQWARNAVFREVYSFVSPDDGIISDIFYQKNEICYRKEEMMTIHQMHDVSINTYFDPNEINFLHAGDSINIAFPDGTKSIGTIEKFFISTYALPSEFQKKYEPTERNIVAKVIPANKSDQGKWKNFYKMDVVVYKNRYTKTNKWLSMKWNDLLSMIQFI